MRKLVTMTRLAELLRVDKDTIRRWSSLGYLPDAEVINKAPHFSVPAVDALLHKMAWGFKTAPTIEALLTGKLCLLTADEAQRKLSLGKDALLLRINTGRIAAIKLSKTLRVDQASVEAYLNEVELDTALTRDQAGHIFGVGIAQIQRWVSAGELESVEVVHSRQLRPIKRESVIRLLRKFLPAWIEPESWIEDRLEDKRPLFTLSEFQRYTGLDPNNKEAHRLMEAKQVLYYRLSYEMRVSPLSADALLEREGPLSKEQVANVFGVNVRTTRRWFADGVLQCKLHQHKRKELYKACVLELLEQYASKELNIRDWYRVRLNAKENALDIETICSQLAIDRRHCLALFKSGILRGVRSPGSKNDWHTSSRQVQEAKRRLAR